MGYRGEAIKEWYASRPLPGVEGTWIGNPDYRKDGVSVLREEPSSDVRRCEEVLQSTAHASQLSPPNRIVTSPRSSSMKGSSSVNKRESMAAYAPSFRVPLLGLPESCWCLKIHLHTSV